MATNSCSPVKLSLITETAFYLEVAQTDVCEDKFAMSSYQAGQHLIRSNDNKFVILNTEGEFQAQDLASEQTHQQGIRFNIKYYNDNNTKVVRNGRAVMLYVDKDKDSKKIVACCNKDHKIHPEEMELPSKIEEDTHKAVFYRTKISSSNYELESSLYPGEYLAFEPDEGDHTLSKLVLSCKDTVDEFHQVIFC